MQYYATLWCTAPFNILWNTTLLHFCMVRNFIENEDSIVIDVTDVIKYIISNIYFINICS